MTLRRKAGWVRGIGVITALLGVGVSGAVAADSPAPNLTALHVTLSNGFDLICDHREFIGERVRLYLEPGSWSFVEVAGLEILSVEPAPALGSGPAMAQSLPAGTAQHLPDPTPDQLRGMMSRAGAQHNLDVDLLASVVRAESGGNIRAVSRTGARGLMQLMPTTATLLGVEDSFHPEQNINGGTAYLDALLLRYHDDIPRALAAYNAGPAAVDRYHGVPPYRETRAYVARVIHEFNRRKSLAARDSLAALAATRTASRMATATENHIQ